MNPIPFSPLEPVIEAVTDAERLEREEYARRLRAMASGDVASEMFYLQSQLEATKDESLSENADEQREYLGFLATWYRWQRDACNAELARKGKRNLLPQCGVLAVDPSVIQDLKSRVDLVQVVEYFTGSELKKRGKEYWTCCPFHQEQTPSFAVNEEKGTFFCHACRVGGDVISFLQKVNNDTFMGAVRKLSNFAGVELPGIAA